MVLIGRALEESDRWAEAAQHYQELLAPGHDTLVGAGDPHDEHALWLHGASRLRYVAKHVTPEARNELWKDWLETGSPEFLERLRLATEDPHWQSRIDRALLLSSLPAEMRVRHLADPDPSLSRQEQRELHLARWDLHVRLGLLAAAQADQRYWQDHLTDLAEYADDSGADDFTARRQSSRFDRRARAPDRERDGRTGERRRTPAEQRADRPLLLEIA